MEVLKIKPNITPEMRANLIQLVTDKVLEAELLLAEAEDIAEFLDEQSNTC